MIYQKKILKMGAVAITILPVMTVIACTNDEHGDNLGESNSQKPNMPKISWNQSVIDSNNITAGDYDIVIPRGTKNINKQTIQNWLLISDFEDEKSDLKIKYNWDKVQEIDTNEVEEHQLSVVVTDSDNNISTFNSNIVIKNQKPKLFVNDFTEKPGIDVNKNYTELSWVLFSVEKGVDFYVNDIKNYFYLANDFEKYSQDNIQLDIPFFEEISDSENYNFGDKIESIYVNLTAYDENKVSVDSKTLVVKTFFPDPANIAPEIILNKPENKPELKFEQVDEDFILTIPKYYDIDAESIEAFFSVKDNIETDLKPYFHWSSEFFTNKQSKYTLKVYAEDTAKNKSKDFNLTIKIDSSLPPSIVDVKKALMSGITFDDYNNQFNVKKGTEINNIVNDLFTTNLASDFDFSIAWINNKELNTNEVGRYQFIASLTNDSLNQEWKMEFSILVSDDLTNV